MPGTSLKSDVVDLIRRITLPHDSALRLDYDAQKYLLLRHLYVSTYGFFNHSINKRLSLLRPPHPLDPSHGSKSDIAFSLSSSDIFTRLLNNGGYATSYLDLPLSEIADINSYLDKLSTSESDGNRSARTCSLDVSKLLEFPLISELIFSDTLRLIADKYLRTQSVLNMVSLCKSTHVTRSSHQLSRDAMMFHFDSDHNCFLKIFIYLSDVDKNCGPHTYIPHTSSRYRVSLPDNLQRDDRLPNLSITRSGLVPEYVCGKAGTIIFADTHNLHRGTPVGFGHSRYILQLQFVDSLFGPERTMSNSLLQLINPNIDLNID